MMPDANRATMDAAVLLLPAADARLRMDETAPVDATSVEVRGTALAAQSPSARTNPPLGRGTMTTGTAAP